MNHSMQSCCCPRCLLSMAVLSVSLVTLIAGCGAEIRPDGPKRVVFQNPDGTERIVEVKPSAELRALAIDQLMRHTSSQAPEIRANAIEALSSVTAQVEPMVALALSDSNEGVRSVAAMVAGQSNLSSLSPTIEGLLTDDSPYVRASALFALSVFRDNVDISELSVLLFEHPSLRVRSHVAYIIGELGAPSAIPMLQQAMAASSSQASPIDKKLFRLQIAEALAKLGHLQSIDTIRAALYPSRPDELEATALAVQIIGEIQDEAAIDQLIYLADENADIPMPAEVRLGVASALAQMGHREGAFVADQYIDNESPAIRAQSAAVYGQTLDRGNLGKLEMMMLNDPSVLARVAAAGAIVDYTQREYEQPRAARAKSTP